MRRMEARLRDQHEAELRRLKENADQEFTRRLKLMEEENEQRMNLMMKKLGACKKKSNKPKTPKAKTPKKEPKFQGMNADRTRNLEIKVTPA